jgi:hypothetical protein
VANIAKFHCISTVHIAGVNMQNTGHGTLSITKPHMSMDILHYEYINHTFQSSVQL